MIDFLIKSSISLLLLLGIYNFLLEKEKMSVFNRFYLLGSLIISFAVPFMKIELNQDLTQHNLLPNAIQTIQGNAIIINQKSNNLPIFLWSIYGIITTLFVIRFSKNIYEFIQNIKANSTQKFENGVLVLIEEKILPHTFLNYIFINKNDYENRKIEGELFAHELTHVRQKHTLDVLFIEILKTIFWFNPILIFYKKAIQLNHEFLADEKVVKAYNNVPFYQSLLLEKASWNSNFYLASNLNFLVTKKRLIMMTKTTSQSRALLKKLAVLPALAGLIFFSCAGKTNSKNNEPIVVEGYNTEVQAVKPEDTPTQPEFPGGMEAFHKYVASNYKFSDGDPKTEKVQAFFVVASDGKIDHVVIKNASSVEVEAQLTKILKASPKWIPANVKNQAINMQLIQPIELKNC